MESETTLYPSASASLHPPPGLWWRRFFIRLHSWEYWPVYLFNLPVLGIWIWYALRSRDFFFFTLTNPGIETGGFFGESKSAILSHIPDAYKPITVLLKSSAGHHAAETLIRESGISFPVIVKPEVGERGWLIKKLHTPDELKSYRSRYPIDFIIQPYVDLPLELSIMVYKMPDESQAAVTSICEKHFLQVRGDGRSTLRELVLDHDRALLQYEKLRETFGACWNEVLPDDETRILEPIGNHCRGTMFLNRHDQIDSAITRQMLSLLDSMPGVYYGRFDLRAGSWDALRNGKDLCILEFNGTSSDPAHIYHPGYSLARAYLDIARHWAIMYRIARQNRAGGHHPASYKKIISALIVYFRYKRTN